MKKELKLRKDENLSQWINRLMEYYDTHETVSHNEMYGILREVSIQSYIHGSNDAQRVYGGVMARKGGTK